MKYKITTAKNAVKKGLVKIVDLIWIKVKVESTDYEKIGYKLTTKIRIPIPEQKPIDFGEAGKVLKNGELIICTTGHYQNNCFSGYLLEDTKQYKKGYCFNSWYTEGWTDITDTYKK